MEKITFKSINDFCPEAYEIYNGDTKIGLVREQYSRIKVYSYIHKEKIIFEKMINQHKEDIMKYKNDIIKVFEEELNGKQ